VTANMKKMLSKERVARATADRPLAKEKTACQATEQSLLKSNEANTLLTQKVESSQASLTTSNLSAFRAICRTCPVLD
jgi:hypothetical protein